MIWAIFCLVVFPVDFFLSRFCISRKIKVAKRLVLFDVWKVSESQKHAKTGKHVQDFNKLSTI
jgi:hypothetical protein